MRKWFTSLGFVLICFLVVVVAFLATLPKPNVLVSADLTSETMTLIVSDPDENILRIPSASVTGETFASACLKDLYIRPNKGTAVIYTRLKNGTLIITLGGPTDWRSKTREASSGEFLSLTLSTEGECASNSRVRLPVAGNMTVGMVAEGASSNEDSEYYLLDGDLEIHGRAINKIFGLPVNLFKFLLPVDANKLYHAETFVVPPGSLLGSDRARWWGFADVDLNHETSAIRIKASSNARSLNLQSPAPYLSGSGGAGTLKTDKISLTFGAQLGNDPNLRWFIALISMIFALLSLALQIFPRKKPK